MIHQFLIRYGKNLYIAMHLNILAIAIKLAIALGMYIKPSWTLVIAVSATTLTEWGSYPEG